MEHGSQVSKDTLFVMLRFLLILKEKERLKICMM